MVRLGIEVEGFTPVGDLQSGLELADRLLGYKLIKSDSEDPAIS